LSETTTPSATEVLPEQRNQGWPSLGVALLIPFIAAAIGGLATERSVDGWYRTLRKPAWNPPAWLFGPVWSVLYLLMGIASWLVWRQSADVTNHGDASMAAAVSQNRVAGSGQALTWYGVQLVANALWPLLFFGARRIRFALGELIVLWALIASTALQFYRIRPLAGMLLVPYFAWTSFAAILNATLWRLNRDRSEGV
jgi:tryptophan-rich sensory protein